MKNEIWGKKYGWTFESLKISALNKFVKVHIYTTNWIGRSGSWNIQEYVIANVFEYVIAQMNLNFMKWKNNCHQWENLLIRLFKEKWVKEKNL